MKIVNLSPSPSDEVFIESKIANSYEVGEIVLSGKSYPTGLVSYKYGTWLNYNTANITLSKSGGNGSYADDILYELYQIFWDTQSNTSTTIIGGKASTFQEDWDAGRALILPDPRGRSLELLEESQDFMEILGTKTINLLLENLPSHNHGGGGHIHTGATTGQLIPAQPAQQLGSRANSYFSIGGWVAYTWNGYAHARSLSINNSGTIIQSQGSSSPFSIQSPKMGLLKSLLIYTGH